MPHQVESKERSIARSEIASNCFDAALMSAALLRLLCGGSLQPEEARLEPLLP